MNLLFSPYAVSCGMKLVEGRATLLGSSKAPTFQYQRFFARGDISFVRAQSLTPGDAFGVGGASPNQSRAVIEVGFVF
jgi:hypothetical protein